jgi:antitoxin VapB
MALNIKDPETERLAAEAATLLADSKTGVIRRALRELLARQRHGTVAAHRHDQLTRLLEEEIWPLLPPEELGGPLTKAEREEILGIGPDGA